MKHTSVEEPCNANSKLAVVNGDTVAGLRISVMTNVNQTVN